jgi:hypothetical protein
MRESNWVSEVGKARFTAETRRWYERAGLLDGKLLGFPLDALKGCKGDRHEEDYH